MKKNFSVLIGVVLVMSLNAISVTGQILDPIVEISTAQLCQGFSQVVYNCIEKEYFVVWEDMRNVKSNRCDIYGQFVLADGTLRGKNFPICTDTTDQWWPHVDFDPVLNRYLVVFSDNRNGDGTWMGNYDIYGALLDKDGRHIVTQTSEADTCFAIANDSSAVHYPAVAFSYDSRSYCVVWADYRFMTTGIYGQRVGVNGELLSPPDTPDATENFAICVDQSANQDVPDISYSFITREWFVVFAWGDRNNSDVYGQRVNRFGKLVKQDGTVEEDPILITENTDIWTDGVQPRIQFNNEFIGGLYKSNQNSRLGECLVTWQIAKASNDKDIYGQRVAFYPDSDAVALGLKPNLTADSLYFAIALDSLGNPALESLPDYPISNADGNQNAPDIAFSEQDNEYIVCWGDQRRTQKRNDPDFYCQRLRINSAGEMVWSGADSLTTVESWENIPVDTTDCFEGGNLVGAAHSSHRNEFFMAYTFMDTALHRGNDLHGRRFAGALPSPVNAVPHKNLPDGFSVSQNYPNPFNPETTILLELPAIKYISIEVYNLVGRKIQTLVDRVLPLGKYSIVWDGKNAAGNAVASGLYWYKVNSGKFSQTKKMLLIR